MPKQHGIGPNLGQFLWLVANTVLVGLTVGTERAIVPLLGHQVYHVGAFDTLAFIASFGLAKAPLNLVAGRWSDRVGRRRILIGGWILGVPMVVLLLGVHAWWAVVVANVFLGANQAFAWTMTISAQLDLVGPSQRGLAMGINEATGYLGVAIATWFSGYLAGVAGSTSPFIFAAVVVGIGFFTSLLFIRDTRAWVASETRLTADRPYDQQVRKQSAWRSFVHTSFQEPTLSAASWAGLVNKLADTVAWGVLPLYLAARHVPVMDIAWISGSYTGAWGMSQFGTGSLSDHIGRKIPIVTGFILLGAGFMGLLWVRGLWPWILLAVLAGVGMALLYPNLNSTVSDMAPPDRRGSILGVYRLWRDGGYFVGGVVVGAILSFVGALGTILVVVGIVWAMAIILIVRMRETHGRQKLSRVSEM
ncbi:MAG: MFS transporter [Sulfobacillus benefaciens]|uniref:MFS transporter n=1 Tax=Sulfobacillus benefaciens TaxID=453960 RepID=A0A2T2WQI6_9FIRM|nr:MAG: MFS transporter [Sulfobacillus benefaciens]